MTSSAGKSSPGTALITGASTGIGRACALHLCGLGFEVFAGVRNDSDAEKLKTAAPGKLEPVLLDVTDERTVREAAELLSGSAREKPLHLVNNAGVSYPGPLEFVPIEDLRSQLEVNVIGQMMVTQSLMPVIRERGGRVAFVSSMFGRFSVPTVGCYCASKHALEALCDALRMELRPWDIPVILVEPGATRTRFWEKYVAGQERLLDRLSEDARTLYEGAMRDAGSAASGAVRNGVAPEAVAAVIGRSLTEKRPRARYAVGPDARFAARVVRLLPARLQDEAVLRYMTMLGRKTG